MRGFSSSPEELWKQNAIERRWEKNIVFSSHHITNIWTLSQYKTYISLTIFFAFCIWLKYRKVALSKSFKNIYKIIGPTQWNFPHVANANPWSKLPLKISIFFEPFAWHQSKMKVHLSWVIFLQIHEDSVEVGVI